MYDGLYVNLTHTQGANYGILGCYQRTYFLKRKEGAQHTYLISRPLYHFSKHPSTCQGVLCESHRHGCGLVLRPFIALLALRQQVHLWFDYKRCKIFQGGALLPWKGLSACLVFVALCRFHAEQC